MLSVAEQTLFPVSHVKIVTFQVLNKSKLEEMVILGCLYINVKIPIFDIMSEIFVTLISVLTNVAPNMTTKI